MLIASEECEVGKSSQNKRELFKTYSAVDSKDLGYVIIPGQVNQQRSPVIS